MLAVAGGEAADAFFNEQFDGSVAVILHIAKKEFPTERLVFRFKDEAKAASVLAEAGITPLAESDLQTAVGR